MRNNEDNEQEIRRRLKKETDKAVEVESATWEKIHQELFTEQPKKVVWMKRVGVGIGTVAVAAILFVMMSSGMFTNEVAEAPNDPEIPTNEDPDVPDNNTGNEPEEKLTDLYEKEIETEVEVEGMKEPVVLELAVNEEERYVIYIQKGKQELRQVDGEDMVGFIEPDATGYPPVAMYIQKQTDTTLEEQIQYVKEDLAQDGMVITTEEEINQPFDAYTLKAYEVELDEIEWDTGIHHYYITEVETGTFFLFKMVYFAEARDGYPARFDMLLEHFEYVGEGATTE